MLTTILWLRIPEFNLLFPQNTRREIDSENNNCSLTVHLHKNTYIYVCIYVFIFKLARAKQRFSTPNFCKIRRDGNVASKLKNKKKNQILSQHVARN